MAVTLTMTWANGVVSNTSCGFILTDDRGGVHQHSYGPQQIDEIKNPVFRAVADELSRQGGSATGTVSVVIS